MAGYGCKASSKLSIEFQ